MQPLQSAVHLELALRHGLDEAAGVVGQPVRLELLPQPGEVDGVCLLVLVQDLQTDGRAGQATYGQRSAEVVIVGGQERHCSMNTSLVCMHDRTGTATGFQGRHAPALHAGCD